MGAAAAGGGGCGGERGGWIGWQAWSVFVNDPQVHTKQGPAVQL